MVNRVQSLRSSVAGNRPTGRTPGELYSNWPDAQLGVINAAGAAQDLIAVRFFSTLTSYNVGDFVVQAGQLYSALVAVTPGAFNPTQWAQIVSGAFLPLTGGTLTGPLITTFVNPDPVLGQINLTCPTSNQGNFITALVGGTAQANMRWWIGLANGVPETGGNAGSDFEIANLTDAGVAIDPRPVYINRATGIVNIGNGLITANVTVNNAAGTANNVSGQHGSVNRWQVQLGDNTAESGANAGSNFVLNSYSDTGTLIGVPITIARTNGATTFNGASVLIEGTATVAGTLTGTIATFSNNLSANGAINSIRGVVNGTDAAAGYVGEVISGTSGSIGLATGVVNNLVAITLTPGDWDVSGEVWFTVGTGGATTIACAYSTVSGAFPGAASPLVARNQISFAPSQGLFASGLHIFPLKTSRASVSVSTPYYIMALCNFPTGTVTVVGTIWARRAR